MLADLSLVALSLIEPLPYGCGAAWAPGTPPGTWPAARQPVSFVLASPASRDLGAAAAAELDVAVRTWTRPACSGFRARYGGASQVGAADDGVNAVIIHDDVWPAELVPGAIAQTIVHVDPNGDLRDADIHLNAVDWRFSLDGAPGTLDARSILVHELGHALGLGHSSDARATMAPNGSGLRWRSLERDDVEGLCSLYPGVGAPGCEVDPCPAGYTCVGGACQRPGERRDLCAPCQPTAGACEGAGDDARCVDVGEGASAGRACGRACATDAECGAGFRCLPTTEAGDLQCVSTEGCRNGASPCATDADCKDSACRGGACLGPPAPAADAGAPPADAAADAAGPGFEGGGGGCDCAAGGRDAPAALALGPAALALAALARRRRR